MERFLSVYNGGIAMKRMNKFDAIKQQFYTLPKVFFKSDKYKPLDLSAKVLYSVLQGRAKLSEYNNWLDENGDIYFCYSLDELQELLNLSRKTIIKAKRQLIEVELLEEEKTGRFNKMYLGHLDVSDMSLLYFDDVVIDGTKVSQEERKLRSKNKLGNQNAVKNKAQINKEKGEMTDSKQTIVNEKTHEVENLHSVCFSPTNQHSSKNEKHTKCKISTSEVEILHPNKKELNIIDKEIDKVIDHSTDNFTLDPAFAESDEERKILNQQFLYDVKEQYAESILQALEYTSNYFDVLKLHRILQNIKYNITLGNYKSEKQAKTFTEEINQALDAINWYHDNELAIHIKHTLIRATRFIYSGKQAVTNREGYYYIAIEKGILNYINRQFLLKHTQEENNQSVTSDSINNPPKLQTKDKLNDVYAESDNSLISQFHQSINDFSRN